MKTVRLKKDLPIRTPGETPIATLWMMLELTIYQATIWSLIERRKRCDQPSNAMGAFDASNAPFNVVIANTKTKERGYCIRKECVPAILPISRRSFVWV
jgi:hypothetical protein